MRPTVLASLVVCLLVGPASAQPSPPAPAEPAPTDPATEPPPSPPPAPSDPAWDAYDDAFAKAAKGERDAAKERLLELSTRWPGHPASQRATSLAARLAAPKPSRGDRVARGELVFWSTVGGVFTAANLCVIAQCESDREYAAIYSASVAGSLGLSLLATRHGVEQGEAQLYNSAQTWGSWNALGINDGFAGDSDEAVIALAGQGAGLLAGIGLWQTWRPSQGDVALANSFWLWGTVMTLWAHIAAEEDPTLRRVVIAGDISILAGALVSTQVKMSRGRTLLIDVGGVLGILLGGLIAVGTESDQAIGTTLLLTTGAGLGIATAVTREWDAPKSPPVAIAPARLTQPGGPSTWGVTANFGF